MKKRILTILSLVVVMALCLSQLAFFGASAEETVQKIQDKYTFLDDEVYYFRDAFDAATEGLETSLDDQTLMPDVFWDGDWKIGVQWYKPGSNVLPYPYLETFCYRQSSIPGFYFVAPHKGKDFADMRSSIGFNSADPDDKNLYFGMGTAWGFVAKFDLTFTAPHGGKIVLFDALNATIDAVSAEGPFWSFTEMGSQKVSFEIWKNDTVKVWPLEEEEVFIDKTTRSIPFPDAGELKVKTGDTITIKISGQPGGVNGIVKLNPAIGYTEYIEDEPEIIAPPANDGTGTTDTNSSSTNGNGDNDGGLDLGLIIGIAAGAVVLVAAVVVIIIVVAKKKKGAAAIEEVAEDAVEESSEEKTEE